MSRIVCAFCGKEEVITADVPTECSRCHRRDWRTVGPDTPKRPYLLSRDDKTFLKVNHIDPRDESDEYDEEKNRRS